MSFAVGIVGLPNVGKSTLFKALTKQQVKIAPRPFTTIHPNVGVVSVPDKRLDKIAKIVKPKKVTPTTIKFIDIAGLVKGAHKGEGLGNQFLAHIRPCRAIIEVVRIFEDPSVEHLAGTIDPQRDIETIKIELLMKDLETCAKLIKTLEKKKETKKLKILEKIEKALSDEKMIEGLDLINEEKELIKEFQFLTEKPIVYLFNIAEAQKPEIKKQKDFLSLNLKLEEEISELTDKETKELKLKSRLDQLILSCYKALNLITFFTIAGGKEARAWTLISGSSCANAGRAVHSDFEKRFIKAEILNWQKLIRAGSWPRARELGWLKIAGRDHQVQDGDVIEFKI